MGSSPSKSDERAEIIREQARTRRIQEEARLLEAQQAALRAQQELWEKHREQRLEEEEKLKRVREAWLHQENLKERAQQEQILREQESRTKRLLQQKSHWDLRVQQETLVRKDAASSTQPNIAPSTSTTKLPVLRPLTDRKVTNEKKINLSQISMKNPPPEVRPPTSTSNSLVSIKSHKTKIITAKKAPTNLSSHSTEIPDPYYARYSSPKFPFVKWTEIDYIQDIHGMSRYVAENIIVLLKKNNAISFIARYRKNSTLGMDVDQLRNVKKSFEQATLLKKKADAFIKEIDKQGICNSELYAFVCCTKSLNDFEWIESLFKSQKPAVEKARRIGLHVPAEAIVRGEPCRPLSRYVKSDSDSLKTEHQVKSVVVCLIADFICKQPRTFETIKTLRKKHAVSIETQKNEDPASVRTRSKPRIKTDYQNYYKFSARVGNIRPHQVLEINRGEEQKIINVKVIVPGEFETDFKEFCQKEYADACSTSDLHQSILTAAFGFAWKSIVRPNIFKLTRQELTRRAETAFIADMAKSAKQLLLIPPVRNQKIMGIQPGFQNGCQLAVVSAQGEVLQTETIHPHDVINPRAKEEAEGILSGIILKHQCFTLALGDGPASRETEAFLTDLIKKPELRLLNVVYAIVDNPSATFYSTSEESSLEFPFLDARFKAAVSLARRLQDPMAELVKIEPRQWNIKIPQHNLPAKQLVSQLNEAIEEAVSLVGVDINTASLPLLKRVAGLNEMKAKSLINWRKSSGPFRTRNDLKKVEMICSETFEQCAGFLKILPETAIDKKQLAGLDRFNYFDQTCIHPEMYDIAEAFLKNADCDPRKLGTKSFIFNVKLFANQEYTALASKYHTTVETMKIIVESLTMEKGFDIRGKSDTSMFRKSLKNIGDLSIGTILTGVVRSNVHFGSFVDVGLEIDGLIHKTKTGGVALDIGQKVETKVINVNKERQRLGLALVRCF